MNGIDGEAVAADTLSIPDATGATVANQTRCNMDDFGNGLAGYPGRDMYDQWLICTSAYGALEALWMAWTERQEV